MRRGTSVCQALSESVSFVPFNNTAALYLIKLGWFGIRSVCLSNQMKLRYQGLLPQGTPPKWMTQTYELCARDARQVLHHQLETTQLQDKVNMIPYRQFDGNGQRTWSNLMSADWAWTQAVCHRNGLNFYLTNKASYIEQNRRGQIHSWFDVRTHCCWK